MVLLAGLSESTAQIKLGFEPQPLEVTVGETVKLNVTGTDAEGNKLETGNLNLFQLSTAGFVPSSATVSDSLGNITGMIPGDYRLAVFWLSSTGKFARGYVDIKVLNKPIAKINIESLPGKVYSGSIHQLQVEVLDEMNFPVEDIKMGSTSKNPEIAEIDNLFNLVAHKAGKTTISIKANDFETKIDIEVIANPVAKLELSANTKQARTGDVVTFTTVASDKRGNAVADPQVTYSVSGGPLGTDGASAFIKSNGKFVAEKPGSYTVFASSGDVVVKQVVRIEERGVQREIEVVGRGSITRVHTADFWLWEAVDGQDYAVTGTTAAEGKAYFWRITNPGSMELIDSIQVDARGVNDVKISEDGKICVISREGASNRKNGIVVLDVTNPADVRILSTFTEGLTGGVHNLFIYKDHVYALSNGQRYDIINIEDPRNPRKVGKFEIDNPGRSIHDVWVVDGIAYSSNWNDGVIMVDVGNGVAGGSPSNPVEIARSKTEGDANHTAFPYWNKETGQFIIIAGDEVFPLDFNLNEVIIPKGYLHFMDFTDINNPKEIARYKVPGAGSHNFWVEDGLLYIGYYNGGLRVVDISGELQGDLYKQGREVGYFLPMDKNGFIPNNVMTWGARPYKGHIYFTDMNSGLWAVKMKPVQPKETKIEVR